MFGNDVFACSSVGITVSVTIGVSLVTIGIVVSFVLSVLQEQMLNTVAPITARLMILFIRTPLYDWKICLHNSCLSKDDHLSEV